MNLKLLTRVINDLAPTAKWSISGNSVDDINWITPISQRPTNEEITAEVERRQAELDANEYQRLRKAEYPPLADFADAAYWQSQGDDSKMTAYLAAIAAVKSKYPKE